MDSLTFCMLVMSVWTVWSIPISKDLWPSKKSVCTANAIESLEISGFETILGITLQVITVFPSEYRVLSFLQSAWYLWNHALY